MTNATNETPQQLDLLSDAENEKAVSVKQRGGARKGSGRKTLDSILHKNGGKGMSSRTYTMKLPSYITGIAMTHVSNRGVSMTDPAYHRKVTNEVTTLLKNLLNDFLLSPVGQSYMKRSTWGNDQLLYAISEYIREDQQQRWQDGEPVYEVRSKLPKSLKK